MSLAAVCHTASLSGTLGKASKGLSLFNLFQTRTLVNIRTPLLPALGANGSDQRRVLSPTGSKMMFFLPTSMFTAVGVRRFASIILLQGGGLFVSGLVFVGVRLCQFLLATRLYDHGHAPLLRRCMKSDVAAWYPGRCAHLDCLQEWLVGFQIASDTSYEGVGQTVLCNGCPCQCQPTTECCGLA